MGLEPSVHLGNSHGAGNNGFAPGIFLVAFQPGIAVATDIEPELFIVAGGDLFTVGGIEAVATEQIDTVLQDIICGGVAACALTIEALTAGCAAHQSDEVVVGGNGCLQRALGEQGRLNIGLQSVFGVLAGGDQLAHQTVGGKLGDVLCADVADAGSGNGVAVQAAAKANIGREDQLVPGVDAIHVGGGVSLGIAQRLGLGKGIGIGKTQAGHRVENVVAGAVHNAAHLPDGLAAACPLQFTQPADAAANRCGAAKQQTLFLGQGDQIIIEGGDQSLVGGDDVLAGFHSGPDELICRVQTTHSLHHGVDGVIVQDILEILCSFRIGQGDVLQAQHLCDLNIITALGQIVKTFSHNAKTKQTDFHLFFLRKKFRL